MITDFPPVVCIAEPPAEDPLSMVPVRMQRFGHPTPDNAVLVVGTADLLMTRAIKNRTAREIVDAFAEQGVATDLSQVRKELERLLLDG